MMYEHQKCAVYPLWVASRGLIVGVDALACCFIEPGGLGRSDADIIWEPVAKSAKKLDPLEAKMVRLQFARG
eukprot:6173882-Amphidinium_carterae.1